ncbi:MAG TPA: RIO1 family regulatory kinase/ATPase [Pseudomonadales bacterium]
MADDSRIDLLDGRIKRGQLAGLEQQFVMDVFAEHVAGVEGLVNDGKEATVYRCRTRPGCGIDAAFAAAKVYRGRRFRAFRNNADYLNPKDTRDRRLARAIRKRSRVGTRAAQHRWVGREWEVLAMLHAAGASVPEPYDHAADAVLMELVGSDGVPAPPLAQVRLERAEADRVLADLIRDVEILLDGGLVHGDLSAYNVLYQDGRPRMIDLPQAVDVDGPADAWALFYRDIDNLCGYFRRQGLDTDPLELAMRLWRGT